ncbi:MAG: GNAT family N-acetyltransferase [bacterium]|nr:GNAT family N-acetyltransferase [bacterium]
MTIDDSPIEVRETRLEDSDEIDQLFEILDAYARGAGGQNAPLSPEARENLGPGLRDHPNAFVLFGSLAGRVVGAAVCVWGFSTFAGRPSLNLHDFSVLPEAQGLGVGTALLSELERRARERGAAKMTLEVHDSNEAAKRLYARFGFEGWSSPTLFVSKPLRRASGRRRNRE